jgi:peptide/nickel transport system permease protein
MWSYTLRRLLAVVPVVLVVTSIIFLLIHMAPGDPLSLLRLEIFRDARRRLSQGRERSTLRQAMVL